MMPTLHNTERARAQTTTATTRTKTRGGDERARQSRPFPPFFKIASFSLSTSLYKINSNIYIFLLSPYLKKKNLVSFFLFIITLHIQKKFSSFISQLLPTFLRSPIIANFMSTDIFILSLTNLNLFCCSCCCCFYAIPHLVCVWKSPKFLMFPIIIRRLLPVLSEMEKGTDLLK